MSASLSFEVPGEPVAKGRARLSTRGGFARAYTPSPTRAYEALVRAVCSAAVSASAWTWSKADRFAVTVHVHRTHEGKGGDVDNYAKAILDAINGIAFADDRYVRRLSASLEAPDRARPRVLVTITRVADL